MLTEEILWLIYCFSSTEQQYINIKQEQKAIESEPYKILQENIKPGKSEVEALELYNFLEKP